jgi:hypothetical protein
MPKLDFTTGLAVFGFILAIILVVLDKAGKLKGPMLLVLLGVAAVMALPLAIGNSWVIGAANGMMRFSRGALLVFSMGTLYSLFAIWISPDLGNTPAISIPQSDSASLNHPPPPQVVLQPKTKALVANKKSPQHELRGNSIISPHIPEAAPSETTQPAKSTPEVVVIFKESPLFTEKRREKIIEAFDEFRSYLVRLGFDIPKDIPPLGVAKGLIMAGGSQYGTVYDMHIVIPEETLDDPKWTVTCAYSNYTFWRLIPDRSTNTQDAQMTGKAVRIVADYFRDSFVGKQTVSGVQAIDEWESALWNLREKYGHDLTDRAMFFAVKRWVPYGEFKREDVTFNSFFKSRIANGFSVLDNNSELLTEVGKLIAAKGIKD